MKKILQWTQRILLVLLGLPLVVLLAAAVAYLVLDHTNGTMVSSGMKRHYLLYVPDSYDPSTPAALVVSLHGFAQWPAHQSQLTGWTDLADEYGFIVVHPSGQGFPRRWRIRGLAGGGSDPALDVTFLSELIDKLKSEYNIDPARIYVNGLSNGGGMSVLLSCELSERIAAVGSVAGAYASPWSECRATRPVPAIVFHGTADPIVPYLGGAAHDPGFDLPSIPEWVAELADHNGCGSAPVELPVQGEVSGVRYEGCDQGAEVVFYTIAGGGHSWPGGGYLPQFLVGHTTQDIDATRVMWEFFQRHPLEGE